VINSCPSSFGGGHYDNHFRLFIDGNYAKTFGESNMSKDTIKVIKGTKTTKDTINKVINFIKKIDAKSHINISSEITCLDIPKNGVQIIWTDGTESILGGKV
tara:strand:- start:535 stop:840 length:306 start_codon:yes stop_codon:yes gene_type:complete